MHIGLISWFISSCGTSSHQQMVDMLRGQQVKYQSFLNSFSPEMQLDYCNNALSQENNNSVPLLSMKANLLLKVGQEQNSINVYQDVMNRLGIDNNIMPELAIAYMRLGERSNCMLNHNGSSCVFPIKDDGVHKLQTGSKKAIFLYEQLLDENPRDLESMWLLNIAHMTLGDYPKGVGARYLIPGLDTDTGLKVRPFKDMAADLGLNINGKAGGVIADDFNNDGYIDIMTSGWLLGDRMHYFQSNKDGTFADHTEESGLTGITGGLNIQQTDYNNDGNLDIFVLRGAWNGGEFGNQPSSLLRNNGDGTFTDVTTQSGLLYFQPTQAAVWADFNNDGWLDVFVGAETNSWGLSVSHPSSLYINNHDDTFTNIAVKAKCEYTAFMKGVTAADYNNDGLTDIFISCLDGHSILLQNKGKTGADISFENVTERSGIAFNPGKTFPTFFFDYNNDGWPDIMACNYDFGTLKKSLGFYAAAEGLKIPIPGTGDVILYRNNHDGTFTDVSKEMGLDKVTFAMGCNFGDIDNDGYLDMYFGTGNPDFKSLIPNKMFKNVGGKRFADVTISSRTGNLQKGHGVAFADFRNVGRQDIFIEMGGAYSGDSYTSSLYVNPGQSNNNFISLKLQGVKANRAAIGSRIKVTFTENGIQRSVYKDVNSGGSFGSSPLQQELGIGQAKVIDDIEIKWAGTQTVQHFKNVAPNQFLHITEGNDQPEVIHLAKLVFKSKLDAAFCAPMSMRM